jgi:hypothetical protein
LPKHTRVYVAHIEGEDIVSMVATAKRLSDEGFDVMPHFPARIIKDQAVLQDWISMYQNEAGVDEALLLAGGSTKQIGEYNSSMQLIESGLFNENGYLRYFKHTLIFPYLDFDGKVCYFQSRAVEQDTHPKELNPRGRIPLPYNAPALKSDVNSIYIAEGAIDCLTILEKGFMAVGIPGAKNFKEDWVPYFKNKKVYLAFDRDRVGREGEMQIKSLLDKSGIECHFMQEHLPKNMQMPDGFDVNDWFVKKK